MESIKISHVENGVMPTSHLEEAILQTVAYVDVFDYPLTAVEIQRYLSQTQASQASINAILRDDAFIPERLEEKAGYYFLPGREATVAIRQQRAVLAAQLWHSAMKYGRIIAHLPFVRMVAVTGSLAVDNPDSGADIDYLIVTKSGRLWLCRALNVIIVRLAARRGLVICPNYFLDEDSLHFPDQTLYTARELTQMIPIYGLDVYQKMRSQNEWTADFLPNAFGSPRPVQQYEVQKRPFFRLLSRMTETLLGSKLGELLEKWEMKQKIRKFQTSHNNLNETAFSPHWCKGHFDGHQKYAMQAYKKQLASSTPASPVTHDNNLAASNHQS